ncbi:hypothetical protein SUDANB66_06437 (plasmid) [Streptomyces sp. SudanB66_2053]
MYAQWPHGKGWDDFLPRVLWNQAQRGERAVTARVCSHRPAEICTVCSVST